MSNTYQKGDEVRFYGVFTDGNNEVQDPANVFFQVKNPSDVATSYQYTVDEDVKKESIGRYYIDIVLSSSGWWWYRWYSTGSGTAADESAVYVEPSKFE